MITNSGKPSTPKPGRGNVQPKELNRPATDFKPMDLVSVKPGVCSGGRFCEEVEDVGYHLFRGRVQLCVMVKGLPYQGEELILELPWVPA